MWLLTLQLFKNSIDTQEKLRLNLHSLSVSELLEYGRKNILEIKVKHCEHR
jgi:Ni,Fe-hydrogenase maturation factor